MAHEKGHRGSRKVKKSKSSARTSESKSKSGALKTVRSRDHILREASLELDYIGEWLPGLHEPQVDDELEAEADRESFSSHGRRRVVESVATDRRPRIIIGRDERREVADTTVSPYCWVCYLSIITANGTAVQGTGWLAGEDLVVTAGHCVWDKKLGNDFSRKIKVFAGRDGGESVATATSKELFTTEDWAHASRARSEFDFGAIRLNEPIGRELGFFGFADRSDDELARTRLNIVGYPFDKPQTQWGHAELPARVGRQLIEYQIDTERGHSGSPVFSKTGDDYTVLGIHNSGDEATSRNMATRINSSVFQTLRGWKEMD